jgi:hypothetical protein
MIVGVAAEGVDHRHARLLVSDWAEANPDAVFTPLDADGDTVIDSLPVTHEAATLDVVFATTSAEWIPGAYQVLDLAHGLFPLEAPSPAVPDPQEPEDGASDVPAPDPVTDLQNRVERLEALVAVLMETHPTVNTQEEFLQVSNREEQR